MKNLFKIISFLFVTFQVFTGTSQEVFGKWKTIDDNTGEAKSVLEIYERNGLVFGKVIEILNKERQDAVCDQCEGADENKPILGLEIIRGLEKDGDEYNGGKILDPESGKLYKCYITLEDPNKLKVRGFIGFSLLGRTQYWHRIE